MNLSKNQRSSHTAEKTLRLINRMVSNFHNYPALLIYWIMEQHLIAETELPMLHI